MTISKRIWSPMPMEDLENVKNKIDSILSEALEEIKDPEAYAVRKMFNKIKDPHDDGFDTAPFDNIC